MSGWSFAASLPVILGGLLLWAGSAWLCWVNARRAGRPSARWLEALRFLLITLLGVTLLRPEYVRQANRDEQPVVAVLSDASGSMSTRDVVSSNALSTRAEWTRERLAEEPWAPLETSARVVVESFAGGAGDSEAGAGTAPPAGTDLNAALEDALQRHPHLKAVLLLSDGDWNSGKSPIGTATRYRSRDVPIFAVAVGQESPVPDLALEEAVAPAYGLFGEQIALPFLLRSHLPREVKTVVALRRGQEVVASKDVVIPPEGELRDAVVWSPRAVGEANLVLETPVLPDESLTNNNERAFRINVRIETLKVLVVDSLPRWEYRYLRNALERDPGVEMHCLLFHPALGPGGGRNYLPAFPGTKELLSRYDVVFLGDVGIGEGELTESDAELLRGLVEQQSSGLVFLPGARGRQFTLLDGPLGDLMPVALDESKPSGIGLQNETALELTSKGKGHLLTRFDVDEDRNGEIWKMLPGFYWSAAVEKSRPGSDVLAVHSSLRNNWGRIPLLVTRSFGSGKVLFMGIDSAWRWRRGVEDKYHYRFWSQVVRWMAHQRHLSEREGIRLTFSPETPELGDTLFLQATVLDAAGFPIEEGTVSGRVTLPSGRVERLEFEPVTGGWGVFKSAFKPEEGGEHKINVKSEAHNRELETSLIVDRPEIEKRGQPVNRAVLDELAEITQGASASYESLASAISQISLLPEPAAQELRSRVWASPWWGGFLLALLGIYWTGRKLAGMV